MKVTRTGVLAFISLDNWKILDPESGETLFDQNTFIEVVQTLIGRRVGMLPGLESISLFESTLSEYQLNPVEPGTAIILSSKTGFSNFSSYLEAVLLNTNGCFVELTLSQEGGIILQVVENQDAPRVIWSKYYNQDHYFPESEIDEILHNRCKIGQGEDTCIFLVAGVKGFSCAKFCPHIARQVLQKKALGQFTASRIGNCRLADRPLPDQKP